VEATKADTSKVNELNRLSENLGWRVGDHDTSIALARNALDLATALAYDQGLAQAHSNLGMAFWHQGELEQAMTEHSAALTIRDRLGDLVGMSKSYGNIGHVYKSLGDHAQAVRYYRLAVEHAEAAGDIKSLASWHNHIGSVFSIQGDHPQAMASNLEALRIQEANGDSSGMTYSFNNIATIHVRLKAFDEALLSSEKAMDIMQRMADKRGLANTYIKRGNIFSAMGRYDEARTTYQAALAIYEMLDAQNLIASSHGNIGVAYYQEGNLQEALKSQTQALRLFERIGDQQGLANTYANIGSIHLDMGQPGQAVKWYEKGLAIAERIGSQYAAMQLCQGLVDAYEDLGDHRSAFTSYQRHIAYRDSLFNEENAKKLTRLEMQYTFDKKEAGLQAEQEKKDVLAHEELQRQKLMRNGALIAMALLAIFAVVFLVQRNRIGKEKDRSESLLLNILPQEVADELKAKGEAEAVHIDQVTVLFTDFKGFTTLSEVLSAKELVRDLHECFSAFDRICEEHGLEKIKTIGDAYMAAGGLPTPNSTHATDVVRAALRMRDFIAQGKALKIAAGAPFFEIRIGVHTGPVVAGIVGVKKFQYDIWGDTVNTASRMESSGEVGHVNISEATYRTLKVNHVTEAPSEWTFTPRGHIEAKGKGLLSMYFVEAVLV